jgi:hypothetical protein
MQKQVGLPFQMLAELRRRLRCPCLLAVEDVEDGSDVGVVSAEELGLDRKRALQQRPAYFIALHACQEALGMPRCIDHASAPGRSRTVRV